jgi:hypothetical protein
MFFVRRYAGSMASLKEPVRSSNVSAALGITAEQGAKDRKELISKGRAYSPQSCIMDFTASFFYGFM